MTSICELAPSRSARRASPVASPSSIPTSSAAQAERMAEVAKALGDPVRMQLVDVLRKHAGKVCVCELVPLFDLSQPTVSHHLKKLRDAGIVGSERRGPVGLLLRQARRTGGTERMAELETKDARSARTDAASRYGDAAAHSAVRLRRRHSGCDAAVRERYAALRLRRPTCRDGAGRRRAARGLRRRPLRGRRPRRAARRGEARLARLRQPDRRRRAARGRDRPRPRLRRRHRRPALRPARRARPARPTAST